MRLRKRRVYTVSGSFEKDGVYCVGFGQNKYGLVKEESLKIMAQTWNLQKGFRWSGYMPDWAKRSVA